MAVESYATYLRMLSAGVPRLLSAQREIRWDRYFTTVIKGKTLVVVGRGKSGEQMAETGKELGLEVAFLDSETEPGQLKAAFESADFLAICGESAIDAEKLGCLPAKAGVINVSSRPSLDEGTLVEKLSSGALSGAILEIPECEAPPADSPLWSAPNLVLIPRATASAVC